MALPGATVRGNIVMIAPAFLSQPRCHVPTSEARLGHETLPTASRVSAICPNLPTVPTGVKTYSAEIGMGGKYIPYMYLGRGREGWDVGTETPNRLILFRKLLSQPSRGWDRLGQRAGMTGMAHRPPATGPPRAGRTPKPGSDGVLRQEPHRRRPHTPHDQKTLQKIEMFPDRLLEKKPDHSASAPSRFLAKSPQTLGNFKAHPGLRACFGKGRWRRKGNRKEERLWPLVFNNFNILIEYQPFRDNADPTLDGMARARGATDIADKLFGRNTGRWAGRRISGSSWLLQGTARGKSLVMQITNSASLILMLKKWCGVVLAISQCVPSSVA